jgi:hypothetical protein
MDGGHNRTRDFRFCLLLHFFPPSLACLPTKAPVASESHPVLIKNVHFVGTIIDPTKGLVVGTRSQTDRYVPRGGRT